MPDWKLYLREVGRYVKEKPLWSALAVVVIVAIYLAGSWHGQGSAAKTRAGGGRKILHYVDPMNPAHTSPEPGLAPCGMKMEPVYEDDGGNAPDPTLPPGAVKVTPQKQQLIGVRLASVEKAPYLHGLRSVGKVAADENRVYQLTAGVPGLINQIFGGTTGSIVQKDEPLISISSPEFALQAQQSYLIAYRSQELARSSGIEPLAFDKTNLQIYEFNLKKLGMSDTQIKELQRAQVVKNEIIIRAPATSFVMARNVTYGQQFERGVEWFRLADLSQVWILADLPRDAAQFVKAGAKVKVFSPYRDETFLATVSQVPPSFDAATQTMKFRLEKDNPGFLLRPGMFVDLEFPVEFPAAISVPVDAVLDSGLKKTVFVARGDGYFEPRKVETGWRLGDRVEITRGLNPGEKIVVSGNFLIDSESRMKLAAAGICGEVSQDPISGIYVEEDKAAARGLKTEFQGRTYYFASDQCKRQFDADPARYTPQGVPDQGCCDHSRAGGLTQAAAQSAAGQKVQAAGAEAGQPTESGPLTKPAPGPEAAAGSLPQSAPPEQTKPGAAPPDSPPGVVSPGPPPGAGQLPPPPVSSGATPNPPPAGAGMPAMPPGGGPPQGQAEPLGGAQAHSKDPVCGMEMSPGQAAATPWKSEYHGKTYYFCSQRCKQEFDKNPEGYPGGKEGAGHVSPPAMGPAPAQSAREPAPEGPRHD